MTSSPTTASRIRSPCSRSPAFRIAWAAKAWARMPPFMSVEPRPQMRSSSTRPEKGSPLFQLAGSPGGTTSTCPLKISERPPPDPRRTPTAFSRPGSIANTSTSQPRAS